MLPPCIVWRPNMILSVFFTKQIKNSCLLANRGIHFKSNSITYAPATDLEPSTSYLHSPLSQFYSWNLVGPPHQPSCHKPEWTKKKKVLKSNQLTSSRYSAHFAETSTKGRQRHLNYIFHTHIITISVFTISRVFQVSSRTLHSIHQRRRHRSKCLIKSSFIHSFNSFAYKFTVKARHQSHHKYWDSTVQEIPYGWVCGRGGKRG